MRFLSIRSSWKTLKVCKFKITIILLTFLICCRDALSLGSSKHWSETLKILTGESNLNAVAMFEYFLPLYDYLREDNRKNAGHSIKNNTVGLAVTIALFWFLNNILSV